MYGIRSTQNMLYPLQWLASKFTWAAVILVQPQNTMLLKEETTGEYKGKPAGITCSQTLLWIARLVCAHLLSLCIAVCEHITSCKRLCCQAPCLWLPATVHASVRSAVHCGQWTDAWTVAGNLRHEAWQLGRLQLESQFTNT